MSSTLGTLELGEWGLASPDLKIVIIICGRDLYLPDGCRCQSVEIYDTKTFMDLLVSYSYSEIVM